MHSARSLLFPLALFACQWTHAQATPPVQSSAQTIGPVAPAPASAPIGDALPGGQIRLNVVVTDKAGHPSTGLPQASFVLQDNGRPLPILTFRPAVDTNSPTTIPTQVLLVIDAVNVGQQTVGFERDQIERFLRRDGGHLAVPVSIVIFTDTSTRIETSPTRDGNALADDLKKQTVGLRDLRRSAGFWGATERYDLSIRTLRQLLAVETTRPGHKLVVWISPGWPYLSGPGIELTRKEQDGLYRSVIDMTRQFQASQVTLYSIDPLGVADAGGLRNVYYETFLKGVGKAGDVQAADLSLQVLATHSGGKVAFSNNDISKEIAAAVAEAGSFYTITAQLPPADQADGYHDLKLTVEAPGLLARTTTGYYTRP